MVYGRIFCELLRRPVCHAYSFRHTLINEDVLQKVGCFRLPIVASNFLQKLAKAKWAKYGLLSKPD